MWGLYILMALMSASIVIKLAAPVMAGGRELSRRDRALAFGVLVLVPLVALIVYHVLGRPDLKSQMAIFTSYQQLDERRNAALAMQPMARLISENGEDIGALIAMGQINHRLLKYDAAVPYYTKALELAVREHDWRERVIANALIETQLLQSDGVVTPPARETIAHILRLHPKSPIGLHYHGMDLAQQGRHAEAIAVWRGLLSEGGPSAYWKKRVREEMVRSQRALANEEAGGH